MQTERFSVRSAAGREIEGGLEVKRVKIESGETRRQQALVKEEPAEPESIENSGITTRKGRKSRKSSKVDMKAKLERSRQSARECRARKKLRYQYLEDLVNKREKAVLLLNKELESYRVMCRRLDDGIPPEQVYQMLESTQSSKM